MPGIVKFFPFAGGGVHLVGAQVRVPACILLDVYLPGRSGLDILKDLNAEHYPAPIFMISGRGDIPTAVDAIYEHTAGIPRRTPNRARSPSAT